TGTAVHLKDVYQIPSSFPFHFNRRFDEESGYRTKSILAVPMKSPQGETIGVVQLINCQRAARVESQSGADAVISYPEECQTLALSLASQAAVAIENNRL
ncbi:MAG TPA: GAF domain-containing protein, partial [Terriglobales bacterium]|nr:GAF domain-containing protein [Terriglobales bacterium]